MAPGDGSYRDGQIDATRFSITTPEAERPPPPVPLPQKLGEGDRGWGPVREGVERTNGCRTATQDNRQDPRYDPRKRSRGASAAARSDTRRAHPLARAPPPAAYRAALPVSASPGPIHSRLLLSGTAPRR